MSFIAKKQDKKYIVWDWGIFFLLLTGYTVLLFTLFHRQTLGNTSFYHSDMKAYILEMQGLESGYEFPYPLFFKLGALFHLFLQNPPLSIALAVTVLNSCSPLVMKYYMNQILFKKCNSEKGKRFWLGILITVSVFACFFVSMVFPPTGMYLPGIKNIYVGVFSPNPFHNATYNATRPFAIVVFFLFAKILAEYENKRNGKEQLLFALFLFLTTITKPSFTFALVPTAGLIMLYRMVRSKFQNFKASVLLGCCFLPTFAALLYQYKGVFVSSGEGESGIGFGLAVAWKLHCDNIPLAIGLALGFPILVLMLNYKELKENKWYRFSWQMLLVSLAEVLFLYEKGFRLPDMNFSWSYMHGIFFVFVSSFIVLIRRTWKKQGCLWLTAAQWLAVGWHLACGIYYFLGIFAGKLYY